MTLEERRTHMWQAIVRRAFTLANDRERAQWLQCFTQSVRNYLDDPIPSIRKRSCCNVFEGRFGHQCLLTCAYTIAPDRSQFDILLPDWGVQYGIDATVFACVPGEDEAVDVVTAEDVGCVLRGMVEHPRSHLHLYEDRGCHELRIGTGLAEPYLFLFQLRFQLCLDPCRRESEIARLRGIFTPEWFGRRDAVSPGQLFGLR